MNRTVGTIRCRCWSARARGRSAAGMEVFGSDPPMINDGNLRSKWRMQWTRTAEREVDTCHRTPCSNALVVEGS